jgi:hypothetical protein
VENSQPVLGSGCSCFSQHRFNELRLSFCVCSTIVRVAAGEFALQCLACTGTRRMPQENVSESDMPVPAIAAMPYDVNVNSVWP